MVAAAKLKASPNLALIDKIFKVGVAFLEEGSQVTRSHGKRIVWQLKEWIGNKGAFERLMCQLETDAKKRRVQSVVEGMDVPPSVPPHPTRRIPTSSLSPLMPPRRAADDGPSPSDSTVQLNSAMRNPRTSGRAQSSEAQSEVSELVGFATAGLNAKDWRQRIDALHRLDGLVGRLKNLDSKDVVSLMDHVSLRLNDGHSKVVHVSLEVESSLLWVL